MSDFTVALAILGGFALLAVVVHGAWTSRKSQPRQPLPAQSVTTTDSVAELQVEPQLEPQLESGSNRGDVLDGTSAEPAAVWPERLAPVDGNIDSVATLWLDHATSGDAILAAMPATRRVGSKPLVMQAQLVPKADTAVQPIEAQASGVPAANAWRFPQPSKRYNLVQIGLQLANRAGPLTDIEYSEFVQKIQAIAQTLGANFEMAEMSVEVQRAKQLDQFAAKHDAQLSFILQARKTPWSSGFLLQCASKNGFVAGNLPGRLVLTAPQWPVPLLVLSFDAHAALSPELQGNGLRRAVISLDVPQVDQSANAFALLWEMANRMALSLDAALVDEAGQAVVEQALEPVAQDLQALYARLAERGIAAGSSSARRLFA